MKIRELIQNLYESATPSGGKMVRGMKVWSPEEFLKSNGIKPENLEQDLD
jgi:hypothetical protein